MKLSKFVKCSDLDFEVDGKKTKVLLDCRTGKIFLANCEILNGLANMGRLSDEEIDTILSDRWDDLELKKWVATVKAAQIDEAVLRIVVLLTSQCNLACGYCGQVHERGTISEDFVSEFNVFLQESISAHPRVSHIEICWFGGEPMLALSKIKSLSGILDAVCLHFNLTWSSRMATNGVLLTSKHTEELVSISKLKYIEVTLDGPDRIHNSSRPKRKGRYGGFTDIVRNLSEVLSAEGLADLEVSVRINLHAGNADSIDELLIDLSERGFAQWENLSLNFAPVFSWSDESDRIMVERHKLAERELELQNLAFKLGFSSCVIPTDVKRSLCVGAQKMSVVFDPTGQAFKCTEHPLSPGYEDACIGKIEERSSLFESIGGYQDWPNRMENGDVICSQCSFLPICGGSCPRQWEKGTAVPCPLFTFNTPERLSVLGKRLGLEVCS